MRWRGLGIWFAVTGLGLLLRLVTPTFPVAQGGMFDDELMVANAHAILAGDWLGAWRHLTLAKPAGYPLLLVIAWWAGLPPPVAAWIVLAIGALLVFTALRALRVPFGLAIVVYAALILDPTLLGIPGSRVYRDAFLASLTVVALGASMWVGLAFRRDHRAASWWRRAVPAALLLGISLGWLYITKSQTVYVVLPLVAGIAVAMAATSSLHWRRQIRQIVIVAAVVGVAAAAPILGVVAANSSYYGYPATEDFYGGGYADAWDAFARVEAGPPRKFVPVTRAQRLAIYAVSPTAARLAPYLELPPGAGWRSSSCQVMGICDESGAWFVWDLRDAVVHAGLGPNEPAFQASLRQMAREIRAACDDGRLRCSSYPAPLGSPPVDRIEASGILAGVWDATRAAAGIADKQQRVGYVPPIQEQSAALWRATVVGIGSGPDSAVMQRRIAISEPIVHGLAWLYELAIIVLGLPIVAFCVIHLAFGRSRRRLSAMALVCLAAFLLGVLILGIQGAASAPFYASDPRYALPASPLLVLGVALGAVSAALSARSALIRSRRERVGAEGEGADHSGWSWHRS